MKLLGNKVLLEPVHVPKIGRFFLVDNPRWYEDRMEFRVVATGPGLTVRNKKTKQTTLIPPEVSPGDLVLAKPQTGPTIRGLPDPVALDPDGRGRWIVDSRDILCSWSDSPKNIIPLL